jgi:hypothetical protein
MDTYERVLYRDGGRVKTATLRNPTENAWTVSGTRVNGQGQEVLTNRSEGMLTLSLGHGIISRTPMRINEQGTDLEAI